MSKVPGENDRELNELEKKEQLGVLKKLLKVNRTKHFEEFLTKTSYTLNNGKFVGIQEESSEETNLSDTDD